jgi:hypothetical protein
MGSKGIFIQQSFPFGGFGPRQWSPSEMGRLFRWLKHLKYTDVAFMPLCIWRREPNEHTLLESGGMYHSGLIAPPPFEPGLAYYPSDRYLVTPEALGKAERLRDSLRLAKKIGLRPWLMVNMTLGSPAFLEDHPELAAVNADEIFMERTGFCPSRPEGLKHLLDFYEQQIRYFDAYEGFILFPRDPGGCFCKLCTPQGRMITRVSNQYYEMIRAIRPKCPISFMSWHVMEHEVEEIADGLPPDVGVFEAPRIHALDAPADEYPRRVRTWHSHGRKVSGWLETQENPTALLPSVYPRRVNDMIRWMKEQRMEDLWQTSAQNPYLFPLHFWMTPKLWEGRKLDDLLSEFLTESFGSRAVQPGRQYIERTEQAWESVQSLTQYRAGFLGLFVITFPDRMLPEEMMRNGVPAPVRRELAEAVQRANEALAAAEEFADAIREFHALDANIIAASAEVFARRVEMRHAKLDVLDALHAGDAESAFRAWPNVSGACDRMIHAARNAPNTDLLCRNWRRLELLPDRLRMLAQHLNELAEQKAFRSTRQPLFLFMGEKPQEDREGTGQVQSLELTGSMSITPKAQNVVSSNAEARKR